MAFYTFLADREVGQDEYLVVCETHQRKSEECRMRNTPIENVKSSKCAA